jgi:hypothetical protein
MRILLALSLAAGLALFLVGALVPGMFALSLIGMVVLAGAASLALAAVMHHPRTRTNY